MANPDDTGPDSRNAKTPTPTELKKELKKLIKLILNEDDCAVQELNKATDEAIKVVSSLRELKIKESVPKECKRPMSREIMGDPVVVASGQLSQVQNVGIVIRDGHSNDIRVAKEQEKLGGKCKGKEKVISTSKGRENAIQVTYDRPSIEENFRQGHKTRPKTKQELTNSLLTPNNLLKNIESLLNNMMSSSLSDQKSSAKTLLQLIKQYPQFRDLFSNNEAVSKLLEPLDVSGNACLDLDLQQDIITTVFNISQPQGNKKVVAENLRVIPLLINALRTGTSKTQSNAAAALSELSELDSNRTLIHESGALGPLIRLVGQGNSVTMTDVSTAMHMLCWDGNNTDAHREKAVSDGAVRVILRKVKDGDFLDLLLPVLATLSSLPSAVEEMRKKGVAACLLKIMESGEKDSNAVKSCAAILLNICSYDKDELKEVKQEEAANGTISSVTLRGTQKGRKKRHWIV